MVRCDDLTACSTPVALIGRLLRIQTETKLQTARLLHEADLEVLVLVSKICTKKHIKKS